MRIDVVVEQQLTKNVSELGWLSAPLCVTSYCEDADVVESVDTRDLSHVLSASEETPGVELLKFGES